MDLQGLSTLVKYGSEILMGYVPKRVSDLATKAGKPVEEMPSKLIAAAKVANELKQLVTLRLALSPLSYHHCPLGRRYVYAVAGRLGKGS